jgi:hypothetical protein
MLGSSMRRVGLIDITVGDAPRRIATFRHATLRVATHHYATLEPLGKPGGSRAFSADGSPLKRLWLRDPYRSQPEYLIADSAFKRMQVDAPSACWLDATSIIWALHFGQAGRSIATNGMTDDSIEIGA